MDVFKNSSESLPIIDRQTRLTPRQNHRLEMIVAILVVIALHVGLVFWLRHSGEAWVKPNEKIIEVSMVSLPMPKAVLAPKPSAPLSIPKPTVQKPHPEKPIKAKTEPKPSIINTTVPKAKPVIDEPKPKPFVPTPVSPQVATQPVASAPIINTPSANANSAPKSATTLPSSSASSSVPVSKPASGSQVACIACPKPTYPRAAQRRHLQGTVQLKLELSADGHVIHVTVLQSSGHAILDEAAVADVQEWRFAPGQPGVSRMATQLINFKM